MTEICKILITSSLTILGGIAVFVTGQLLMKSIIEPIHNLKKIIGEIDFALSFHAPSISSPADRKDLDDKAQDELRKLSCDLRSNIRVIPSHWFWSIFISCSLPPRENILSASRYLMNLSNSIHQENRLKNVDIVNKIRQLLNLEGDDT